MFPTARLQFQRTESVRVAATRLTLNSATIAGDR